MQTFIFFVFFSFFSFFEKPCSASLATIACSYVRTLPSSFIKDLKESRFFVSLVQAASEQEGLFLTHEQKILEDCVGSSLETFYAENKCKKIISFSLLSSMLYIRYSLRSLVRELKHNSELLEREILSTLPGKEYYKDSMGTFLFHLELYITILITFADIYLISFKLFKYVSVLEERFFKDLLNTCVCLMCQTTAESLLKENFMHHIMQAYARLYPQTFPGGGQLPFVLPQGYVGLLEKKIPLIVQHIKKQLPPFPENFDPFHEMDIIEKAVTNCFNTIYSTHPQDINGTGISQNALITKTIIEEILSIIFIELRRDHEYTAFNSLSNQFFFTGSKSCGSSFSV